MNSLVVAVGLFGAGAAASLSPCVIPLVPGWLGVLVDADGTASRAARVAAFCAGSVATFTVLGSFVAVLGSVFDTASGTQRVAGLLLVLAALAAELARRGRLALAWHLPVVLPRAALLRAFVLGVGCGAAWTPCVGPLLGAALTAAGGSGSVWRGASLLALFGMGTVTPLVALSFFPVPRVPASWRRVGLGMQRATPMVLLAFGLLLLLGWYGPLVQRLPIAT